MPDKVSVNNEKRLIEGLLFGDVDFDNIARLFMNIKKIHKETGYDRAIIDGTKAVSLPSTSQMYNLASMFPQDVKLAVVKSKDKNLWDDINFGRTVALNRGVLVSLFDSKKEALKWLLG